MVFAQHYSGIVRLAQCSLLLAVNIQDRPPGIGTCPHILAKYRSAGPR